MFYYNNQYKAHIKNFKHNQRNARDKNSYIPLEEEQK